MKKLFPLVFLLAGIFSSCSKYESADMGVTDGDSVPGPTTGNGQGQSGGLMTAGEWNDLDNWDFWMNLNQKNEFKELLDYWKFYPVDRYAVLVLDADSLPVTDAEVKLLAENNTVLWQAKTDNAGHAELWQNFTSAQPDAKEISINFQGNTFTRQEIKHYKSGTNTIILPLKKNTANIADIMFVVDATCSMGDEINFLKNELSDVLNRVKQSNGLQYRLGSVFYRDETDLYLTKSSPFSDNIHTIQDFINQQSAGGGGDYPEAVEVALAEAVDQHNWSNTAKTRLLFLILDAPPHYTGTIIEKMQKTIAQAAAKGIKVIPVTASGIDKQTEFLMRSFALGTNGTYVFITDHSGIGEAHLEATVGQYKVEYLNDLLVRLITKYTK